MLVFIAKFLSILLLSILYLLFKQIVFFDNFNYRQSHTVKTKVIWMTSVNGTISVTCELKNLLSVNEIHILIAAFHCVSVSFEYYFFSFFCGVFCIFVFLYMQMAVAINIPKRRRNGSTPAPPVWGMGIGSVFLMITLKLPAVSASA